MSVRLGGLRQRATNVMNGSRSGLSVLGACWVRFVWRRVSGGVGGRWSAETHFLRPFAHVRLVCGALQTF